MRQFGFAVLLLTALTTHGATPESRAVDWLAREVPAWSQENKCFSCHNNGDGARALYHAKRAGYDVPAQSLAETTQWLTQPKRWDDNKGDPAFSDKRLANLQFAAALRWANENGFATMSEEATMRVAKDQSTSGAWEIDTSNPVGSPITYGTALATYLALHTLIGSSEEAARRRAWTWLGKLEPKNTPSAAALLLASRLESKWLTTNQIGRSIAFLESAQNPNGGWGPFRHASSESFDTAIAVLALAHQPAATERVARGRQFLIREQTADGSWPATTRPAKGESYAQQVSTTAWALMALLETAPSSGSKAAF